MLGRWSSQQGSGGRTSGPWAKAQTPCLPQQSSWVEVGGRARLGGGGWVLGRVTGSGSTLYPQAPILRLSISTAAVTVNGIFHFI